MDTTIKKNSILAWVLAARPQVLVASSTPVIVATALAYHYDCFRWQPALICLLFAVVAQIIANYANDYFDYIKGSDNDRRVGPKRAVLEGWIEPKLMLYASLVLTVLNSALGLTLLFYGGWILIPVGIAVAIFAIAYSGGPYPLAYRGWGDVCVFIFFGIIPIGFVFYLQSGYWSPAAFLCGCAVGLVVVNILVVNNYRDRETDAPVDKRTTVVIFGERFGRYFYFLNGLIAVLCCQYFWLEGTVLPAILPLAYLIVHLILSRKMVPQADGVMMNRLLEYTAKNTMLFGITLSIGLILRL